jgi:hypothetical protein
LLERRGHALDLVGGEAETFGNIAPARRGCPGFAHDAAGLVGFDPEMRRYFEGEIERGGAVSLVNGQWPLYIMKRKPVICPLPKRRAEVSAG